MNRGAVIAIVVGWLLGAGTLAGWVALSGGWYEYHVIAAGDTPANLVNQNGWEPVPGSATVPPGYAINYRRARFVPHADMPPPAIAATPTQTPVASSRAADIRSKVAALTSHIREMIIYPYTPGVISLRDVEYEYAQGAYTALDTELLVHGDHSPQAEAVRTALGPLKAALDRAHTSNNNDALLRLAIQLERVMTLLKMAASSRRLRTLPLLILIAAGALLWAGTRFAGTPVAAPVIEFVIEWPSSPPLSDEDMAAALEAMNQGDADRAVDIMVKASPAPDHFELKVIGDYWTSVACDSGWEGDQGCVPAADVDAALQRAIGHAVNDTQDSDPRLISSSE